MEVDGEIEEVVGIVVVFVEFPEEGTLVVFVRDVSDHESGALVEAVVDFVEVDEEHVDFLLRLESSFLLDLLEGSLGGILGFVGG